MRTISSYVYSIIVENNSAGILYDIVNYTLARKKT